MTDNLNRRWIRAFEAVSGKKSLWDLDNLNIGCQIRGHSIVTLWVATRGLDALALLQPPGSICKYPDGVNCGQ